MVIELTYYDVTLQHVSNYVTVTVNLIIIIQVVINHNYKVIRFICR